jgi:hypothetical protein
MSQQGLSFRLFTATLILLLAEMCGQAFLQTTARAEEPFQVVRTASFEGVIIPGEKAKDFIRGISGSVENEVWTPRKNDILKLEKRIGGYLKTAASKASPRLWSRLPSYKRQYVGVVRGGRKMIFASFFCQTGSADWKTTPIMVLDGGDCYFNILYDTTTAEFSNLQINGEA